MAIASVVQRSSSAVVYDEKGKTLVTKNLGPDGRILGYTSSTSTSTFTIQKGSSVFVFDEKGKTLSTRPVR